MSVIETNIVSYWMRGDPMVIPLLKACVPSNLSLSDVTLAVRLYGREKSPVSKKERRLKIKIISSLLGVYPFDEAAAERYAVIRAQLERAGEMISERDVQIAAIAMGNRLTVVTHNVRDFRRIDKLNVEDWATG